MCKVANCKYHGTYQNHVCVVCDDQNSDHYATQCPLGKIVYHGTSKDYAKSIESSGFIASKDGRWGQGVYMTTTFGQAKKIAEYKFAGNAAVIEAISMVHIPMFKETDPIEVQVIWFHKNAEH